MWCNQIFSLLSEEENGHKIENIIVADNYEIANRIARLQYGDSAIAIDTTLYPVAIGYTYQNGRFYDSNGKEIEKNPTEDERIKKAEQNINTLTEYCADLLYSQCLLQLGIEEESKKEN